MEMSENLGHERDGLLSYPLVDVRNEALNNYQLRRTMHQYSLHGFVWATQSDTVCCDQKDRGCHHASEEFSKHELEATIR